MAKRNQQAKTEKSTVAVRFMAILLMLVMLVGVVMAVLQFCTPAGQNLKPSEWFSKTEQNKPDDPNKPDDKDPDQPDKPNPPAAQGTGGGLVIPETVEGNGIATLSSAIDPDNYADYGINPHSDSAYTIRAALTPSVSDPDPLTWTLEKENASDPFWSDFSLEDIITLTPNGLSATIECSKDFGAKINVKVASKVSPNICATVSLGYRKRIKTVRIVDEDGTTISSGKLSFSSGGGMRYFKLEPTYSLYTHDDEFTFEYKISMNAEKLAKIKAKASELASSGTAYGLEIIKNLREDEWTHSVSLDDTTFYDFSRIKTAWGQLSPETNGHYGDAGNSQAVNLLKDVIDAIRSEIVYTPGFLNITAVWNSEYSHGEKFVFNYELVFLEYIISDVTTDKDEIIF